MRSKHYLINKIMRCLCCGEYIYWLCKKQAGEMLWSKMERDDRYKYIVDFLNENPEYLFTCIHNNNYKDLMNFRCWFKVSEIIQLATLGSRHPDCRNKEEAKYKVNNFAREFFDNAPIAPPELCKHNDGAHKFYCDCEDCLKNNQYCWCLKEK